MGREIFPYANDASKVARGARLPWNFGALSRTPMVNANFDSRVEWLPLPAFRQGLSSCTLCGTVSACAMQPRLDAVFFATVAGREPVREWLLCLERWERRQVGTDIAYVQWKWPIGKPRVDHLRGSIWEIRSNLAGRTARVLFAVAGTEMILLHGFLKKSRKTLAGDIELAESRWKEWRHAETQ